MGIPQGSTSTYLLITHRCKSNCVLCQGHVIHQSFHLLIKCRVNNSLPVEFPMHSSNEAVPVLALLGEASQFSLCGMNT